ncbi:MAG: hypothetical protein CK431_04450 [Mycobacterium sp.]|nr:MAG: hypothetical protein CK431_04450 [Mycobacterium sp.]
MADEDFDANTDADCYFCVPGSPCREHEKAHAASRATTATVTYIGPVGGDSYANAALANECAELAALPPRSRRNQKLNEAAFKLERFVRSGALAEQVVHDALVAACKENGLWDDPDDGPASVEATIKSGLTGGNKKGYPDARKPMEEVAPAFTIDPADMQTVGAEPTKDIAGDTDTPSTATLEQIEDGFWGSRESLKLIFDASIASAAAPWATFAVCVARTLSLVPIGTKLPPIVGADGAPPNWFAAISAKSGGGKGLAMGVGAKLIPAFVNEQPIGSGEGMVAKYQRDSEANEDSPRPVDSVMFTLEEISTLGSMRGRQGQTTVETLLKGWSGEKLGFSYSTANQNSRKTVERHSYRMTLIAAVQPERAGILFDEASGGLPQRFMWFPGRDKRIVEDELPWPKDAQGRDRTLAIPSTFELALSAGTYVKLPPGVAREVRRNLVRGVRGDNDALDGHIMLCREKVALALAILEGRIEVTDEDWRLSGIATDVSNWCRERARDACRQGRYAQARERGAERGHENDERALVEGALAREHVQRIVNLIVKHLTQHGAQARADLYRRQPKGNRSRFDAALEAASQSELIVKRDNRWELA